MAQGLNTVTGLTGYSDSTPLAFSNDANSFGVVEKIPRKFWSFFSKETPGDQIVPQKFPSKVILTCQTWSGYSHDRTTKILRTFQFYFFTRYTKNGWRCQRARTDWDWPSSAGLCNYVTDKTYPEGCSENLKRVIRRKAKMFSVRDGELYYKKKGKASRVTYIFSKKGKVSIIRV